MKKKRELPLVEPIYSTYHCVGSGCAVITDNPSIRNWYLNSVGVLRCTRKFLEGYASPELFIEKSRWGENPYLEKNWLPGKFFKGYINPIIREFIDNGYYVHFDGIDDYYFKGKSWYKHRHFCHDGLICGYDQEKKTYSVFAYDSNWIYRKFEAPQKCFNNGRRAMERRGIYASISGIKPLPEQVVFDPQKARQLIKDYLHSSFEKYPLNGEGVILGIVVQEYLVLYLDRLIEEKVCYERMDYRIFRLIWEHKKVMLERIINIENALGMDNVFSERYRPLVDDANTMRMLYASHHLKRRDSVLPIIRKKILSLSAKEKEILTDFINKTEGNEAE